jgi:hypothetical protein
LFSKKEFTYLLDLKNFSHSFIWLTSSSISKKNVL